VKQLMSVSGFKENFGVKDAGAIGVMFFCKFVCPRSL